MARFPTRSFANLSLNGVQQAHLVLSTITRFCQSMDRDIAEDPGGDIEAEFAGAPERRTKEEAVSLEKSPDQID